MPNRRTLPKWLAFLVPISLAFAVVATIGCGSDNDHKEDPPAPSPGSSEVGLANLVVSHGTLAPAFSSNIKDYALANTPITDPGGITITATLKDTRAKLYIDEVQRTSGQPVTFPYPAGVNTKFWIKVVGEDNRYIDSTWLTINRRPLNTKVWALEGIGGAFVRDAVITLTDMDNNVLVDSIPLTEANQGKLFFALDPEQRFNIYATGRGVASSCIANYDPSREDTAALYCLRTFSSSFEYSAPIITDISIGPNNSDAGPWNTAFSLDANYNQNYIENTRANLNAVRVTAIAKNQMGDNYGNDLFSTMRIAIDEVASANMGGSAGGNNTTNSVTGTVMENSVAHPGGYYRTQHRFATPALQTEIANKNHWLSVVVYDQAANRTEQRLYLTVTNAAPTAAGDPDISEITPNFTIAQAQTFGVGLNVPGVNPVDAFGAMVQMLGQFNVQGPGNTTNRAIRGYEVERSTGNPNNFKKVMTVNFTGSSTNSGQNTAGIHQFVDRQPDLEVIVPQYYRVRAFNGNPVNKGFSRYSNVVGPVEPLAPFTTKADYILSEARWPQFRFRISNSALVNTPDKDTMRFLLYVKGTDANYPLMLVPFQVYFNEEQLDDPWGIGNPSIIAGWVTAINASSGALTLGGWYDATMPVNDVDEDGNPIVIDVPWAWMEPDGTFVVDTNNWVFQSLVFNAASYLDMFGGSLLPGASYQWSVFGTVGGLITGTSNPGSMTNAAGNASSAYITRGWNAAPNDGTFLSIAYGSSLDFGYGSPDGFFTITISADAD